MVKYKTSDSVCFIGYALLLAICSSVLYLSGFGNDKFVFFRATAIVTITELIVFIYISFHICLSIDFFNSATASETVMLSH